MGRGNPIYVKDLHQQAYDCLTAQLSFGESKRQAVKEGTAGDKIFSFNTYKTYWKHIKYFLRYVQTAHPDCRTVKKARRYVGEWLQLREEQGLSAWTVQTEAKALGKLYGIQPDDPDYYAPPKRRREDIKRSRGTAKRDAHFSEVNNQELVRFCKGSGVRRREFEHLYRENLLSRQTVEEQLALLEEAPKPLSEAERVQHTILQDAMLFDAQWYIHITHGKGGRQRISPILGEYEAAILERFSKTEPGKRVWEYVSSNADIHGYRGDYATQIYKKYARPIGEIPYDGVNRGTGHVYQKDVYTCRKDESRKKLDKAAMQLCSKALGHNRIEIVANNYIRNL